MRKQKAQQSPVGNKSSPSSQRVIVRCEHCRLVQFDDNDGLCRRCKQPLGKAKNAEPDSRAKLFALPIIENGFPLDELSKFAAESKLPFTAIYDIVIAARTLKHRKARAEPLSREESDRLARLIRLYEQACRVFANAEKARWWLGEAQRVFDGRTPLQMIGTEFGGRLIEEKLIQIDEGMFA